jgi:hypothetical protein
LPQEEEEQANIVDILQLQVREEVVLCVQVHGDMEARLEAVVQQVAQAVVLEVQRQPMEPGVLEED